MSKRPITSGAQAIERRLAAGRGQGRGAAYRPWIEIHDFASRGLANRVKSPLHGRVCHLFSKLEADFFLALHALPGIRDLREQFPLTELAETVEISARLGIAHPAHPTSKQLCLVTSDFLVTFGDGLCEREMAVAIKPSADLGSPRTLEKLEIERTYWRARNVDWRLLTERELPPVLVKNLRWLHPLIDLPESGEFTTEAIARIRMAMEPEVHKGTSSLANITKYCDDRLGLKPGASLSVARHLIAAGRWPVDLSVELNPCQPLRLLPYAVANAGISLIAA